MSANPSEPSPASRLDAATAGLLILPPLVWAGNSVLGRVVADMVPPITLNFFRWLVAFVLLLPWSYPVLKPQSPIWGQWRRYGLMSLLGVGCYNSLQYLALHTSTPINVTLVAASVPIFMLALGALFYHQRITPRQALGAALSIAGVLWVLVRGEWHALGQLRLGTGDLYVLLAVFCWAWYSWMVAQPVDPPEVRQNWAYFLTAQMVFGLVWSGAFTLAEWQTLAQPRIDWGWPLAASVLYVALGPALLAYRSWGLGIQRVGPNVAGFFANLTPLFAALISTLALGDAPQAFHALAFALIVGGIVLSSKTD